MSGLFGFADDLKGGMLFLGAWVPGTGAGLFMYGWRQTATDDEVYSALGWVMTVGTVFLVAFSVLWYVLIVLRVLDIMDPHYYG